jgi:tRNA nucleotidyltransferase (CCA-adding enzyme)
MFAKARQIGKRTSLPALYLCLLIYNLTEKANEQFISRLNFSKNSAQAMNHTLQIKAELNKLAKPHVKSSDIYQLIHGYSAPAIQANALASESLIASQQLHLYLTKLRYVKPILNGEDLKKMGIPSGPEIGEILSALQKARLDGEVKTRKDEEKLINHLC